MHVCEKELHWLDIVISLKKSCCLRIGCRMALILWIYEVWQDPCYCG